MLSAKELTSLTELLGEASRPLDQVSSIFKRSLVATKNGSSTNLAAVLEMLIRDNLLLHTHQKLIAYYVMSELHEGSTKAVPLFSLLVSVIAAPAPEIVTNYWERNFAAQLLLGLPKEVRPPTWLALALRLTSCCTAPKENSKRAYRSAQTRPDTSTTTSAVPTRLLRRRSSPDVTKTAWRPI